MPADDALLFIDANKYLDLYRTNSGKKLLSPLVEQVDHIFVTKRVVEEVQRNKIDVVAELLAKTFKGLKPTSYNLPDHLSDPSGRKGILDEMKAIVERTKKVTELVDALGLAILKQVSRSEDEVSKALAPLFAKSSAHSNEELERARDRRESGNPPGKSSNPLGDQLSWEQILSQFQGKRRLWIVSRDEDYGTHYGGKSFLNCFLYDELQVISKDVEVYLFADMVDAIAHFVESTGVHAERVLTPAEVKEIREEEESLPPVSRRESFDPRGAVGWFDGRVVDPNLSHLFRTPKIDPGIFEAFKNASNLPEIDPGIFEAFKNASNLPEIDPGIFEAFKNASSLPEIDPGILRALEDMRRYGGRQRPNRSKQPNEASDPAKPKDATDTPPLPETDGEGDKIPPTDADESAIDENGEHPPE